MILGQKTKWLGAALIGAAALAVVVAAILLVQRPALDLSALGGRSLTPPAVIPPLSLIDHRGQPFDNGSLEGRWTLAMIGFTFCPDICPTILSKMAAFFKRLDGLPGDGKAPRFVFISVDPFRDTPEKLGQYVEYFDKRFIGVTGTPENLHQLVTGLGLHYIYTDPEGDRFLDDVLHRPAMKDYGVVHSTRVLFISPRAELVAFLSQPFEADGILAVFTKLRDYYGD